MIDEGAPVFTEEAISTEAVEAVVAALPLLARGAQGAAHLGLSVAQVRALGELARAGPLPVGELARRLGVSCAAVSQLADQLAALGLAQRERAAHDRRVVAVQLTPRAHALIDAVQARRRQQVREAFAQLAPAEQEACARGVRLLTAVLVRDLHADAAARAPAPPGEAR